MFFRPKPPIRRSGKGVEVDLGRDERALLQMLTTELRHLIANDADDPGLRRLFPTAYLDDPQRDAEYQILARHELIDARLSAIDTMQATIGAAVLSDDELGAWMTTVNQLRLVLGTRLDISEDDPDELDEPDDPDDPEFQQRLIYHWLSGVLALIIDASRL